MVYVYFADTVQLNDDSLFEEYYRHLSPYRKRKTDRLIFRKDRNLSLGAGILLDCGLQRIGLREETMEYGEGEYGKPFFLHAPDVHFSLSHSEEKVMLCITDTEIGCDIEKITDTDMKTAERFFHPNEFCVVSNGKTPAERRETFFRLWTLKESFLKAKGFGLSMPLNSFEIDLEAETAVPADSAYAAEWHFAEPKPFDGYRCAICMRNDAGSLVTKYVSFGL